jgi:hypothetical protein
MKVGVCVGEIADLDWCFMGGRRGEVLDMYHITSPSLFSMLNYRTKCSWQRVTVGLGHPYLNDLHELMPSYQFS